MSKLTTLLGGPLDDASMRLIKDIDPRLAGVIMLACVNYYRDFPGRLIRITSGHRSSAEQEYLVSQGTSPTMRSFHLTGQAVDLAILADKGARAIWTFGDYARLDSYIQAATRAFGMEPKIDVQWGGAWKSRDGVHWQIVLPLI